jgi:hypothetical protein
MLQNLSAEYDVKRLVDERNAFPHSYYIYRTAERLHDEMSPCNRPE